jgi:hypothetical protein
VDLMRVANGNKKAFDSYSRCCLQDPVVSISWWLKCSYQLIAAPKHPGR